MLYRLWVAVISTPAKNLIVAGTREQVDAALDGHVKTYWLDVYPDYPLPDTAEERVAQFFDWEDSEDWYEMWDLVVDPGTLEVVEEPTEAG